MPKTKEQKQTIIDNIQKVLSDAKSVVLVSFDKIKLQEIDKIRKECRAINVNYQVVKKNLLKIAMKNLGIDMPQIDDTATGIAIATSLTDEVGPAKVTHNFAKNNALLKLISGVLKNNDATSQVLDFNGVTAMASLPGKQELQGMVCGTLKSLLYRLTGALNYNTLKLIMVLKLKSQKE